MTEALDAFEIDTIAAAPTVFRMLARCEEARPPRPMRKISFSGEPMDAATDAYVRATFGTAPCSMYGTTEIGVVLGNYPGAPDFEVKPGALGKPFPGLRIEIHDVAGNRCEAGTTGELVLWRRGRWIPTRDRGRMDSQGYFYHAGRADDVIISAGWTLSAVEIEDVLRQHDAVTDAAVIGVSDELRGQVPMAFVVTDSDDRAGLVRELQDFVRARLGQHEYPRAIEFVDVIPTTPAGKANRKALRERFAADRVPLANPSGAPR
jgi:acetyl-CoA synthetase